MKSVQCEYRTSIYMANQIFLLWKAVLNATKLNSIYTNALPGVRCNSALVVPGKSSATTSSPCFFLRLCSQCLHQSGLNLNRRKIKGLRPTIQFLRQWFSWAKFQPFLWRRPMNAKIWDALSHWSIPEIKRFGCWIEIGHEKSWRSQ